MNKLDIRVTDDLVITAGSWEEQAAGSEVYRVVHPPETTMYQQLLDYVESRPPVDGYPGISGQHEALVAVALCLRWGSYLAVLADETKPPVPAATDQSPYSQISDAEMCRINIEASAALEQWIELMRVDYHRYLQLMWVAHRDLPMTYKTVGRAVEDLFTGRVLRSLANPLLTNTLAATPGGDWYDVRRAQAQAHPTRVLANALMNACWRNGPVENFHASPAALAYPLTLCRLTRRETRALVLSTATRLKDALLGVSALVQYEESERAWWERVLPYHTANPLLLVTPAEWSLDQQSCEVQLPGSERH